MHETLSRLQGLSEQELPHRAERWRDSSTGKDVGAVFVTHELEKVEREIKMLRRVNDYDVKRVVKCIEQLELDGHKVVVLELVGGMTLGKYTASDVTQAGTSKREELVRISATQLMDTLTELHHNAKLAHLNINCNNIMLCQPYEDVWDSLRLMDLGSAQKCSSEFETTDINPGNVNMGSAAPEVIIAMTKNLIGEFQYTHLVSGPAADMWSCGVALYTLLTGETPFVPATTGQEIVCMDDANKKRRWQDLQDHLRATKSWDFAVLDAMVSRRPVRHPMISKIRACSSVPNHAVDFFTHLLHPVAKCRLTPTAALHHPYLLQLLRCMKSGSQLVFAPARQPSAPEAGRVPRALGTTLRLASAIARPVTAPIQAVAQLVKGRSHLAIGDELPQLAVCTEDHFLPAVAGNKDLYNTVWKGRQIVAAWRTNAKCMLDCKDHELPDALLVMRDRMLGRGLQSLPLNAQRSARGRHRSQRQRNLGIASIIDMVEGGTEASNSSSSSSTCQITELDSESGEAVGLPSGLSEEGTLPASGTAASATMPSQASSAPESSVGVPSVDINRQQRLQSRPLYLPAQALHSKTVSAGHSGCNTANGGSASTARPALSLPAINSSAGTQASASGMHNEIPEAAPRHAGPQSHSQITAECSDSDRGKRAGGKARWLGKLGKRCLVGGAVLGVGLWLGRACRQ